MTHSCQPCSAKFIRTALLGLFLSTALVACQDGFDPGGLKAERPLPKRVLISMKAKDMRPRGPVMMRIFKKEGVLEVWKKKTTGRYALLKSYDICKWSGKLGPKFKEGDRQAPEGFYWINRHQMNPRSSYYLSFNMGFPNTYDRSNGRTGSHLMIHGACSSAGCYSMTDEQVSEIYGFARESFKGGQKAFQVQAFPFRMTAENMFAHRKNQHYKFWKMLKQGYDHFEITRIPPKTDVCNRRYQFNVIAQNGGRFSSRASCPGLGMPQSLALSYLKVKQREKTAFEELLAKEEGRPVLDVNPVTFATALPGIKIIQPKAEEPAVPGAPAALENVVTDNSVSSVGAPQTTSTLTGPLSALPGVDGIPVQAKLPKKRPKT